MFIVSNFLLKIILPIAVSAIGTFFKLFVKSLTKNFYLLSKNSDRILTFKKLVIADKLLKGDRHIVIYHTACVEGVGKSCHIAVNAVGTAVYVGVNMVMTFEKAVPFRNGEMTKANLIATVCHVKHFFRTYKTAHGFAVL